MRLRRRWRPSHRRRTSGRRRRRRSSTVPATFTASSDGTYLVQTIIGEHTLQMQLEVVSELLVQIETTGFTKVLVDARAQQHPPRTLDAYTLWTELAPRVPRGGKFAVIVGWGL